jgi:hypothetical protein
VNTRIQYILPACVLTAGLFLSASNGLARPDYTRRTKQECSYCHPPGGWYLNDAGKYFRDHRNLEGYKPPAEPPKTANQNNQNQSNQKSPAQNNEKSKSPGK